MHSSSPTAKPDLPSPPEARWQSATPSEAAERLSANLTDGLSAQEAQERLNRFGPNQLYIEKKETFWEAFFEELREPMVLLLLFTGILYAIWGELSDAVTIFIIIITLNTIEVVNEQRSKRAIASLRKLAEPTAPACRNGRFSEIPFAAIVPGDLILLQDGRRVLADARLIEAYGLAVDESALTGEALPVEKEANLTLAPETPLAERINMVYTGTLVTRGRGLAVVTATGMETEIGRIAGLARQVKEPRTPLQKAMRELSGSLVWLALGFSVVIPLLGIVFAHQPLKPMLLTGLSLAFATIPEEMPIIITMVLALGAYRLSRQHAIVRRLKAVETLGAVTVIATDKTGTLTENRMEVARLEPEDQKEYLLELGILCNNAVPSSGSAGETGGGGGGSGGDDNTFTGDPLDAALLRAARANGIDLQDLRACYPLRAEFSFDNIRKRMSVIYQRADQVWSAVKGAPEMVLTSCLTQRLASGDVPLTPQSRTQLLQQAAELANLGLRVLGVAERRLDKDLLSQAAAEADLTFIGFICLADPPRSAVKEAIAHCRKAGIRTIMITGDHPLTARAIAEQVGLDGDGRVLTGPDLDRLTEEAFQAAARSVSIFARTTPEHKLRIVQALENNGERVAVTGDGVNDAPALAAADIGVAMGETGTDVAREAGDMILADDNFATIVTAVREGRLLYENLQKGVRYYLACKVALVLATLLPVLLLAPVPFAPVQIIIMELFMDLAAAAAFVAEPAEADLLDRPPRDPQARFMNSGMVRGIFTSAVGLFAAVSIAYLVTWYTTHDLKTAQTTAFYAWLLGHVLLALNMRSQRQPIFQLGLGSNPFMLYWTAAVLVGLGLLAWITPAQQVVKVAPLQPTQWTLILITTMAGSFWIEVRKLITFRPRPN